MNKRVLSLLLAVCMLVSFLPAGMLGASAADAAADGESVEYHYLFSEVAKAISPNADYAMANASADSAIAAAAPTVGSAPWTFVKAQNALFSWLKSYDSVFLFNTTAPSSSITNNGYVDDYIQIKISIDEAGAYTAQLSQLMQAASSAVDVYVAPADSTAPMAEEHFILHATNEGRPSSGYSKTPTVTEGDTALYLAAGDYIVSFVRRSDLAPDLAHRYVYLKSFSLFKCADAAVKFAEESVAIEVGTEKAIAATVAPVDYAGEIAYESSDESVATVAEDGTVTAHKAGVATITATAGTSDSYTLVVCDSTKGYDYKFTALYTEAGVSDLTTLVEGEATAAAMVTAGSDAWSFVESEYAQSVTSSFAYLDGFGSIYLFASYNQKGYGQMLGGDWTRIKITVGEDGTYVGKFNWRPYAETAGAKIYLAPTDAEDPMADEYELMRVSNKYRPSCEAIKAVETPAIDTEGVSLLAGDYYVTFNQWDQTDRLYRYLLLNGFELLYAGAPDVMSITVSGEKIIQVGDELALSATVLPATALQDVEWSSSSDAIAEVDEDGVVTAKAGGKVTITATAMDGTGVKGSVTFNVLENAAYDYKFKEVGVTLGNGGDGNLILNKDRFLNNYEGSSIVASSAPWCYVEATTLVYLKSCPNRGLFIFSTKAPCDTTPTDTTLFKIQVPEDGQYVAEMVYDQMSEVAGAEIYLAPAYAKTQKGNEEYLILDITNADRPTDGSVVQKNAVGQTVLNLSAGEYFLYFKATNDVAPITGEDGKVSNLSRYFYIDNFRLYKTDDFETPAKFNVLNAKNSVMAVGETAQLDALAYGDNGTFASAVFESSDESVITVDGDGLVTAIGEGYAYVEGACGDLTDRAYFLVTEDGIALKEDYKFEEVGRALLTDSNDKQSDLWEVTSYDVLSGLNTGSSPWYHIAHSTSLASHLPGNGSAYGIFMFNGMANTSNEYVTIKIKVDETAEYAGVMLHSQTHYTTPTNIYVVPAAVYEADNSKKNAAEYLFIETDDPEKFASAGSAKTGYETVSSKTRLLGAGEYYVTFQQNFDGYDTHQRYFYPWNLQLYKVSDGLATVTTGAQIRVSGEQGLRFISMISSSLDMSDVEEYGTILIPTEDLKDTDGNIDIDLLQFGATINGHTVAVAPNKAAKFYPLKDADNNLRTDVNAFTAVLIKVEPKNYARSVTARAYAKLKDGTYVYGETFVSRSILEVAQNGLTAKENGGYLSEKDEAAFQEIVKDYNAAVGAQQ